MAVLDLDDRAAANPAQMDELLDVLKQRAVRAGPNRVLRCWVAPDVAISVEIASKERQALRSRKRIPPRRDPFGQGVTAEAVQVNPFSQCGRVASAQAKSISCDCEIESELFATDPANLLNKGLIGLVDR